MSHRAAVENYLIDVALIDKYWNEQSNIGPTWKHGPSPGLEELSRWMNEAARKLVVYQAARWALASLKPSKRWPEIRTTWTERSGDLPPALDELTCLGEAKRLVQEYKSETANVSDTKLEDSYKKFFDRFSAETFLAQNEYLVWFHGKDLKKEMQTLRPDSISLNHFFTWAVENLDWKQHADLVELAEII